MEQKEFASQVGATLGELQILRVEIEKRLGIQTMFKEDRRLLFRSELLELFQAQKEKTSFTT